MKKILNLIFLLGFFLANVKQAEALMADILLVQGEQEKARRILEGEIIEQSFTSPGDDFGIVSVKFSNNNKINDDFLIFRIKEKNASQWYYQNQYKVDQFQNNQFFPFGFPRITQALGKEFIFEIESTMGKEDNSVSFFLAEGKTYSQGKCQINGRKVKENLVFKVATEKPAQAMIFKDISQKIKADPWFFVFWSLLIFTGLFFLIKV